MRTFRQLAVTAVAVITIPTLATAADVQVKVTVENLAPMNSISFAPLRIGFNNGTYDSFNNGAAPSQAIISIAEGGSGADWFPAFGAADATAVLGTVVPNPAGPLTPGATGMGTFAVDPAVNPYFTFAAMAVPSNDYFIGNDSPTAHELFDGMGNLNIASITLTASDLWDAGSEVDGTFGAAFLQGSMNSDHTDENGVVGFDFADLSVFNGETTAANYTFDSQLTANTDIYRISFAIVPEPSSAIMLGATGLVLLRRRRRIAGRA
ncbi:MAG: spondin domain-containing protein [Phycisphaerales bacterium]|nr:spondin domain-containing protein [Phycisphaerales bacterium]